MALSQKSILIAEVGGKAGAWSVQHLAEFVFPEGVSLEQPAELGQALKQFMRGEKFSTRETVIGLSAKRLVTRRKEVPPAAPVMAASMLRLQAEGEFSSEPDALVMDFAGETSATTTTTVLLMAVTRENVDQCSAMTKAAGLKLTGLTVTAAALGQATSRGPEGSDGVVVSLAPGGAELVVQHGGATTQVRHLNVGDATAADSLGVLAGEIRRTVAALPRNGSPLTLAVWSSTDSAPTGSLLEQRLNMPVTTPDLRMIASGGSAEGGINRFAPAVAVALAELDGDRLPVDFLHSRLAPPPPASVKKKWVWGIGIAAAVLVMLGAEIYGFSKTKADVARDEAQLASMKKDLADATTARDRLDAARRWAPGKPVIIACMRDLTKLFPDEGSIWVTGLYLHPNLSGELLGKASNTQQVLNFTDRLNNNPSFKGAKWTDAHEEANRGGNEVSFTIAFVYHPEEAASGTK
jgi:hypothetical protein